jgi:hypothetical protein
VLQAIRFDGPARVCGIFDSLDEAIASLPDCYFTSEAVRLAQHQWKLHK